MNRDALLTMNPGHLFATPISAMFGGGVTAEGSYVKDDSRVDVKIITDSLMMQGMVMMFSNPMIATSDGGKLQKINGKKPS